MTEDEMGFLVDERPRRNPFFHSLNSPKAVTCRQKIREPSHLGYSTKVFEDGAGEILGNTIPGSNGNSMM